MATRNQCKRALSIHEDGLSRIRNVVGLGIVPLEERLARVTEYAVAVYVRRRQRETSGKSSIPAVLSIPGRGGELAIPTRVIEQGEVTLESGDFELE